MFRKLLNALACVVLAFGASFSASADNTYLPLQEAHTGLYTDSNYVGEGVNIYTFDTAEGRQAFVLGYFGKLDGQLDSSAPWVYASGKWSGTSTTLPVCTTSAQAGVPRPGVYCTPIGYVTFTAEDANPDRLYARWYKFVDPEYSCESVPEGYACSDPENYPAFDFSRTYDRLSRRFTEPYRCALVAPSPPAPGC